LSMDEETLDIRVSSIKQNYGTHGFFRFYGKLPPLVVRSILKSSEGEPIVDIMCGSGTTLVESMLVNRSCVGVDVNPFCVLVTKVKTTLLNTDSLRESLAELETALSPINTLNSQKTLYYESSSINADLDDKLEEGRKFIPKTNNVDFWFEEKRRLELGFILYQISKFRDADVKNFFRVALASIIRKVSKASPRAGKLFRTDKKDENVISLLHNQSTRMINGMDELNRSVGSSVSVETLVGEIRNYPLRRKVVPVVFWHPPYLALYRYSAIYVLEMDWLGFDRKKVRKGEIEEGYKSGEIEKYHAHLRDLLSVLEASYDLLETNGQLLVVIADSSMRGKTLPVVSPFLKAARERGFAVDKTMTRKIRFSQAVYHPSSRGHICRPEDKILFLRKTD
jgi:hypothetical protein